MRCGILLNTNQKCFFPYLEWIIDQEKNSSEFEISSIHSNKDQLLDKKLKNIPRASSLEELINISDIVFSFGYWKIIKSELISSVPYGIVNFHHSYRLKYKGRDCSTWALRNNEKFHGSTMHYIDKNLDCGTIIDSKNFIVSEDDTAEDLFNKASKLGFKILVENFYKLIRKEKTNSVPMDEEFFVFKRKDLIHEISNDFFLNQRCLLREIRALTFDKKKSPYIVLCGQKIYLKLENYDSGTLEKQKRINTNDEML